MIELLGAVSVLSILTAVLLIRRRFLVVTVRGPSMEPTYHEGERVLVRRTPIDGISAGQVVVVEGSVRPHQWIIKRAAALPGDLVPDEVASAAKVAPGSRVPKNSLVLLGDNRARSADSRFVGYYAGDQLIGVVSRRMKV
ncbi:S26 family signal peptidase [Rhizohabitans arisaemae]|uniref:S26 family signal peptidase n=1 Tax=Rhizohabitans arisaemae TaxID=2720610 RepID=UPI0024B24748|nr:S26 family signal peptidase [Rhizohabitans arisaemae]